MLSFQYWNQNNSWVSIAEEVAWIVKTKILSGSLYKPKASVEWELFEGCSEISQYEWRKWVQLLTITTERLKCGIVTIMHASIAILFPVRSWHEHYFTPVYIDLYTYEWKKHKMKYLNKLHSVHVYDTELEDCIAVLWKFFATYLSASQVRTFF